ncbi:MAG TPA: GMC family oxidoreductase, partial [Longimicrobium sp.]|nr:GMC family oxidoreductase [Longimicrobium sp.]
PLPDAPDPAGDALAVQVAARIGTLQPHKAREVAALLSLAGSRAGGMLGVRVPRPFASLPAARQDAWLRRWETSRAGVLRTAFQGLRRLIISTYYAQPEHLAACGNRGPLHERLPVVPWEGPLPGTPSDDEPVARGTDWPPRLPLREGVMDAMPSPVPPLQRLTADVCVVGSGAGGAVAAARLAAAGYGVVVLEEGGLWHPAQFTEREAEMTTRLYADAGTRATDDLSVPMLQGRAVGGSTLVNWLVMLRTPDWVLDEWADEHGAMGMRPAEMAPVFARMEAETHTRIVPDDAHSPANRLLLDGSAALGWSARALSVNAHDCVRSGFCGLGCRYGARRAAAEVYLPRAQAAGARVYANVRVDRVEVVERGGRAPLKRVLGTVLDAVTGKPSGDMAVEAPVVVLAGGAVGTPALLQRSGMGGGGVGRFLRLHPTTAVFGRYGREMYQAAGIPLSVIVDEFLRGADGYGFWLEAPPLYPALASVAVQGFGAAHRRVIKAFPNLGSLIVLARDGAARARSSGGVSVDRRGRVHIRYRLTPADRATLVRGMEALARLHLAMGAEDVATLHVHGRPIRTEADVARIAGWPAGPNQLGILSAHVNGTCRLGTDPRISGCTPDGERFGVPGLYVVDGSLLPTAPGVNPQETIMAMATVIAERIARRHPRG